MRSRSRLGGLVGNVEQYGNTISSGIFQPSKKSLGGFTGSFVLPTSARASGAWRIDEAAMYLGRQEWPRVGVVFEPGPGVVWHYYWIPSISFGFEVNGVNFDAAKISFLWQFSTNETSWLNLNAKTSRIISLSFQESETLRDGWLRLRAIAGLRTFYSPNVKFNVIRNVTYWSPNPSSGSYENGSFAYLYARVIWEENPDLIFTYVWQKLVDGSWEYAASGGSGANGTTLEIYVTQGPVTSEDITIGTYRAVATALGSTFYSEPATVSLSS